MVIRLEGKCHRQGVSKAGKNYDFWLIYFLAPKRGVDGQAAFEQIVTDEVCDTESLLVGQHYDLEVGFDGKIESMLPCSV